MSRKTLFEKRKGNMLIDLQSGSSLTPYHKTQKRILLAGRISEELHRRGMTYTSFAHKLGKHPSEISKWLSGKHNFQVDTLFDIETCLNIELLRFSCEEQVKVVEVKNKSHKMPGGFMKELVSQKLFETAFHHIKDSEQRNYVPVGKIIRSKNTNNKTVTVGETSSQYHIESSTPKKVRRSQSITS